MGFRLFGWNSVSVTEKIHRRLERLGIISLGIMTIFEFLEWKFWNAFWNRHNWLQLSGVAALAVLTALEIISLKYGERRDELQEIESLKEKQQSEDERREVRSDSSEYAMTTEIVASKLLDRHLSDADRAAWKNTLTEFAGQKFEVAQIGFADYEAENFAREITTALKDCGWNGDALLQVPRVDPQFIFSGVAVHVGISDGNVWNPLLAKAAASLLDQIRASKIVEGGGRIPIKTGCIVVVVGQKP